MAATRTDLANPSGFFAYLRGVREEWGKITWPTSLQLIGQIFVVLVVTTFTTIFVWCIDLMFRTLIAWVVPVV